MDILRNHIITLFVLVSISSTAVSTPVDSTWDLFNAIEYRDGNSFLDLMSESVRIRIETSYQQLQELASEDPEMADAILNELGINLSTWDLEWMTPDDFISRMLFHVNLPPFENIISEEVSMSGRNAEVLFTWHSGYSLLIQFVWEDSSWKVNGCPVLDQLF